MACCRLYLLAAQLIFVVSLALLRFLAQTHLPPSSCHLGKSGETSLGVVVPGDPIAPPLTVPPAVTLSAGVPRRISSSDAAPLVPSNSGISDAVPVAPSNSAIGS